MTATGTVNGSSLYQPDKAKDNLYDDVSSAFVSDDAANPWFQLDLGVSGERIYWLYTIYIYYVTFQFSGRDLITSLRLYSTTEWPFFPGSRMWRSVSGSTPWTPALKLPSGSRTTTTSSARLTTASLPRESMEFTVVRK